ncbi:MAG: endonuclease/exonuclease/phosphatase family protein [Terrimicrobiaceae bacterium]
MFTALTLNIQNGEPWTGDEASTPPVDIAGTCRFLASHPVDFLFLQEVEQGYDGGHQVHPAPNYQRLKAALPDYESVFSYPLPNRDEIPFGLGLAIFSRWPLRGFWKEDLPVPDITFEFGSRKRKPSSRLLMGVEASLPEGKIALLNTHLQAFFMVDSRSDSHPAPRNQVEQALRRMTLPSLLAGDFNCAPGETLIEQFAGAGFLPAQTTEITWRRRPYTLDHIFFNSPIELLSSEVIPTLVSDHHAVKAAFRIAS